MSLIAYWKCNENRGTSVASVIDHSGHMNNHDLSTIAYWQTSMFVNKRYRSQQYGYIGGCANPADLRIAGSLTVMAWLINIVGSGGAGNDNVIVGCGDGSGNAQSQNLLWSLVYDRVNKRFGMRWEHTAGVDVDAWGPLASIREGMPNPVHVCCIRTVGVQSDVKFVKDGVDLSADVTGLTNADGGGSGVPEIGRIPLYTPYHVGFIWNVRVYDEALSVPDVLAIRNSELDEAERLAEFSGSDLDISVYPRAGWSDRLA